MKTLIKYLLILALSTTSILVTNTSQAQQANVSVSFSVFHDNLRAYGTWTNHPRYGQVWRYNQRGFTPYSTGGHWVYTDYGWTWVSDYSWGWATFHYGRWAYEPAYGWYWVPGYEWAPAWVTWRTGGDYYGWAPLGPGLSVTVGYASIPSDRWVFVPRNRIADPHPYRYYQPRTKNVTIIKNTTVINNVHVTKVSDRNVNFNSGPRREDVERDTKTKINVLTVNNSSKPGKVVVNDNSKTVNIYKPDIDVKTVDKKTINNNSNNDNDKTVNKNSNNDNDKKVVNSNKNTTTKKEVVKKKVQAKKPAPKPQAKPAPKPQAKPAPKPQPKPQAKPQPKPQEHKPDHKPDNRKG